MPRIKPTRDLILIKEFKQESRTTSSGLYIPETSDPVVKNGVVIETGPGKISKKTGEPMGTRLSSGMRVVFHGYAGTPVEINGEEFILVPEDDILGRES